MPSDLGSENYQAHPASQDQTERQQRLARGAIKGATVIGGALVAAKLAQALTGQPTPPNASQMPAPTVEPGSTPSVTENPFKPIIIAQETLTPPERVKFIKEAFKQHMPDEILIGTVVIDPSLLDSRSFRTEPNIKDDPGSNNNVAFERFSFLNGTRIDWANSKDTLIRIHNATLNSGFDENGKPQLYVQLLGQESFKGDVTHLFMKLDFDRVATSVDQEPQIITLGGESDTGFELYNGEQLPGQPSPAHLGKVLFIETDVTSQEAQTPSIPVGPNAS